MYSHHKNKHAAPSRAALDLKMPLQPIYQMGSNLNFDNKSGFRPLLSSLADAPPLTSGGKTSISLSRHGKTTKAEQKTTNSKSGTKEGSRLSLSSLDYLPEDTGKSKSSPILKASLTEGHKAPFSQRSVRFDLEEDSDEATHFSYEETDYDGEEMPEIGGDLPGFLADKHFLMDASQLSPILSSAGSPEPAAVNTLVKLGAQRAENNMGHLEQTSKRLLRSNKKEQGNKSTTNEEVHSTFEEKYKFSTSREKNENNSILNYPEETNQASLVQSPNENIPLVFPAKQKAAAGNDTKKDLEKREESYIMEKTDNLKELEEYWDKKFHDVEEEQKKLIENKKKALIKSLEEELSKQSEKELKKMKEQLAKDMENEKAAMEITLEQLKQANAETLRNEQQNMIAELQEAIQNLQEETKEIKKKELEELKNRMEEEHKQVLIELEKQLKEKNLKDLKQKEAEHLDALDKELKALKEKMSQMLKEKQDIYHEEIKKKISDLQAENDKNLDQETEMLENKETILKELEELHLELKQLKELVKIETEAVDLLKNQKTVLEKKRVEITEQIEVQSNKIEEQRKGILELQEQKYSLQHDLARCQKEVKNIQYYLEHLKKSESTEISILKQGSNADFSWPNHAENHKLLTEMSEHEKSTKVDCNDRPVRKSSKVDDVINPSKSDSIKESDQSQKSNPQPLVNDNLSIEHEYTNDGSDVDRLKIRVDSLENCMRLLESRLEKKMYLDSIRNEKGNQDINSTGTHNNESLLLDGGQSGLPSTSLRLGVGDRKNILQTTFPKDAFIAPFCSSNHISPSGDSSIPSCICDNGEACLLLNSLGQSLRTLHQQLHFPSWTLSLSEDHSTVSTSALRAQLHNYQHKLKEHRDSHQRAELKFKLTAKEFCSPSQGGCSEAINSTSLKGNTFHPESSKLKDVLNADSPARFSGWLGEVPPSLDADIISRAQRFLTREQGARWSRDRLQRTSFTLQHDNGQNTQDYSRPFSNVKDYKLDENNGKPSLPNHFHAWPTFGTYGELSSSTIPSVHGTECAYFYRSEFPLPSPLPYSVEQVRADHDQWMARIDSMHHRIRNHERMSFINRALLKTASN